MTLLYKYLVKYLKEALYTPELNAYSAISGVLMKLMNGNVTTTASNTIPEIKII